MFFYNSHLLFYSAVSKYQNRSDREGHGLCVWCRRVCGVWWELGDRSQVDAVPPVQLLSLPFSY